MSGSGWLSSAVWLARHTGRLVRLLALSAMARVAAHLLGVALLVVAATSLARAAIGERIDTASLIVTLIVLALLKSGLRYLEHFSGHWVAFTALQRLRDLFFARLIPQAPAATRGRAGADLTARAIGDIDRIEAFFAHTFPPIVAAVVVPVASLSWLALAVSPSAAGVAAPFVAAVLLIPVCARGATRRAAARNADLRGALAARVGDDIQGTAEVLALGAAALRLRALDDQGAVLARSRSRTGALQALRAGGAQLVQLAGAIAIVAWSVVTTADAPATAAAFAVTVALWGSARGIDGFVAGSEAAFAATARIRTVIDAPPLVRETLEPQTLSPGRGGMQVRLVGVTLRYPGGVRDALSAVDAVFPAARWSYLAGVSGSGKSSVVGLLLRGWEPMNGRVELDGVPVDALALDDLRRRVALVPQRPTLLSGTLVENLRIAAPDAPLPRIRSALHAVDLLGWVDELPDGLDTIVRARGLDVSGGQLQRLALARALAGEPDVLVLDEALSQLDHATAAVVRERVAALDPQRTVIEISHRVDLIPDDAHTVVLDAGRVRASDEAGRLRDSSVVFAQLEARTA